MKDQSKGKSGKGPSQAPTKKATSHSSSAPPQSEGKAVKTTTVSPEVPGLTKKTRPELMSIAQSMGIFVADEDRRVDLIEKIKKGLPKPSEAKRSKDSSGKAAITRESSPGPSPDQPVSGIPELLMTQPSSAPPMTSSARSARGWKDFLDIPFEPVRRERGHMVTILPVSPFRIMAFFSMDRTLDPVMTRRIDESGLVLKIRDITSAFLQGPLRDELPTDHVFDIMTGFATRWSIPLWSANRIIEAWLGFYDNGSFQILARSKRLVTPKGAPSTRMGSIFHLRERLKEGYLTVQERVLTMEAHWKESWAQSRIKLPTSHEAPSGHYKR